jgi:hypothetical protein
MLPALSVTRKFPSGKKATDQGLVSLEVTVVTSNFGEGLDGGGASVCPGNAGFGLGDCAHNEHTATAARVNLI